MVRRNITFVAEGHKYVDEDNNIYTSVTTVIGQHEPKFDLEFWAAAKAKEFGLTPSLVKQRWADYSQERCDIGNVEHNLLEDSINTANGKSAFKFDKDKVRLTTGSTKTVYIDTALEVDLNKLKASPLGQKYPIIYGTLEKLVLAGYKIYAEVTIYWYEFLISGRTDCIAVKGKEFIIVDWKTNAAPLAFVAGYHPKVNGKKDYNQWINKKEYMYPPVDNRPKCKGTLYILQLSMYAKLFELWGYVCKGLILYHIRDNATPKPYSLPYWRTDCERILQTRLERLKSDRNKNSGQKGIIKFGIT